MSRGRRVEEWEIAQEVKEAKRRLKIIMRAFSKVILTGRWGTWRVRHPHSTPLAPIMAIGRLLRDDLQEEWAARTAGGSTLAVLFDADGWPKGVVLFDGDLRQRKALYGVGEIRASGMESVDALDPFASAARALLRKLIGPPGPRWSYSGANLLRPTSVKSMLALWLIDDDRVRILSNEGYSVKDARGVYAGWASPPSAQAARAIRLLMEGPEEHEDAPELGRSAEWDVSQQWPHQLPDAQEVTVMNWLKPYRLRRGDTPTIVRIEATAETDWLHARHYERLQEVQGTEDWDTLVEALKEAGSPYDQDPDDAAREEVEANVWEFFNYRNMPPTERTRHYQVASWEMDDTLHVVASIDAGRVVRDASSPQAVIEMLEDILGSMRSHLEWTIGDRNGYSDQDYEYGRALERALEWATLKHVIKDQAAADKYVKDFNAKHPFLPKRPTGRSNRRTRRSR